MRKKKSKNQLCAICGRPIAGRSSKEHVFPRAIWKWNEEYIEPNESLDLLYAIDSKDNIVKTHPDCNYDKGDNILAIDDLYLIDDERAGLISVYEEISGYIDKYLNFKKDILEYQDFKCRRCGAPVTMDSTLRRIDKSKARIVSNAGIFCKICNENMN